MFSQLFTTKLMSKMSEQKQFQYHRCGILTDTKLNLILHISNCTDEREFQFQDCGEIVIGISRLKNCLRNHKTSFCEICEMVMSPKTLQKHLKTHGIGDQIIYKCPNCDYSSKTNYARHLKSC